MKTLFSLLFITALSFQLQACGASLIKVNKHYHYHNTKDPYTEKMTEAMQLWKENKTDAAAGLFERIALKEKENWLPYYYACMVYTTDAFRNKNKKQVTLNLKKAQNFLNDAGTFSDDEVEIKVVQALLFLAEMMQDPQNNAQTMAPKIEKLYMEAVAAEPSNPRAVAGLADWKYGGAKWMGQDTAPYCQAFEKALLLFDNDTPSVPFGPTWGKDRIQQLIAECNK